MKKLLSILLSVILMACPIGLFELSAFAETSGNYTYTVSNGEATITKCSTSVSGSISIPSTLGGYPVTSIGYNAFSGCTGLTSITIPDSVTWIGSNAFSGCSGLTSITIPDSVTSIGNSAFYGCRGLTSVTIGNSVTSIGSSAFYNCKGLTSITIPDSVTSIGRVAFSGCVGLSSITIPDSVTSIGELAFRGCTGLTSITIPDSVTEIGYGAFEGCRGLTSITIPDSVTSIGERAFRGCTGLTSVTIPDSVTSIGFYAFGGCTGLTSVTIPDSVTSIGELAFSGCTGLKEVTIPDSVTSIGNSAFSGCTGLTSVTIGNSVTSIGNSVFSGCTGLKDIFYKGTAEQKTKIGIGSDNSPLTSATWHYVENLNFEPATCTKAGYTGDMGWAGYETVFSYGETIPALGHDYKPVVTPPTCTAQGYTTYTCSRCGDSYIDSYTNELGHNYNPVISDPTCTARGYTTHTCSRCGDTYKDNYTYMPCGENAGFIIENNTLYIHGAGETNNWKTQGSVPWYDYSDQITEVIIDEGITKIGTYAFYCLNNLESVICKNEDLEFGRYALNTTNENLTVYSKNGALTEYCGNNGIRFIDVTATPELVEVTANSLTVKAVSGYEYSKDTVNWQTSGVFIGLSPVTEYNIYARLIKTKDEFPGKISEPLTVTTDKATVSAPAAPDYYSHTETTITVAANPAYEYSIDGENWQISATFDGLNKNTIYRIYARVAETETEYASEKSRPLIIAIPDKPQIIKTTGEKIILKHIEGFEYCLDDFVWQDSATFNMLLKDTEYSVYQRLKAVNGEKTYQINSDAVAVITQSSGTIPGDINGDDAVNNKDLTRLFQYLSDWDVDVNEAALDINGDGSVNNKDLTRLFQYLSDWDVEIF